MSSTVCVEEMRKSQSNQVVLKLTLDQFTFEEKMATNRNEQAIRKSTAGRIRIDGLRLDTFTRKDLKFGDHLHYGSFGDLIVRGSYVKSEGSVKADKNGNLENKEVAVKIVRIIDRRSGKNDGRSIMEILNKMDVAGRMKHENVVRMDGFAIEEMTCYIVLEPMESSLSEIIRIVHGGEITGSYTAELEHFIGSVVVNVVKALAYLSSQNISAVITPRRVLISSDGQVKIGVSAALISEDAAPIRYSSPELLERKDVGNCAKYVKAGVWSLGATLIETATGLHAFAGSIDFVIEDQILNGGSEQGEPQIGYKFSVELRDFIKACLFRSVKLRASVGETDANNLQSQKFYKHHANRSDRHTTAMSMLQHVRPHLHGIRKYQ